MKKVIQIFLGIVMAVAGSSSVQAACRAINFGSADYNMATIPVIDAAASADLPDGAILFSTTVSTRTTGSLTIAGCAGKQVRIDLYGISGPHNTTPSGIPGIGARLVWTGQGNIFYQLAFPSGYLPQTSTSPLSASSQLSWAGSLTLELVKTGPLSAGRYTLARIAFYLAVVGDSLDLTPWGYIYGLSGPTSPIIEVRQNPTCSVSSPSMQVSLGSVPIRNFSGVGSTSPQSQLFNIQLACSGGDTGATTKVFTTLTDQTNPANELDTLSLASGSTASGVGIQVLSGTTPIKFGPDSSAAGNTNQWQAGSTGNGAFNIPLTARYVQTAPTITAGSANGLATFTMNYQ